jgi:NlpC/P60 family putative phage cell wall peptidase
MTARIIAAARGWIGTPFHHQASLKRAGTDCLGLVRGVWREVIGPEPEPLPPYHETWAEDGHGEMLCDALARNMRPLPMQEVAAGDVLLFRLGMNSPARHAGIMTGRDTMVHAWSGHAVAEVPISPWWRRRMACAFRFPDVSGAAQAGPDKINHR